jgi:transcriptional regulator with XRE-family HTH domain
MSGDCKALVDLGKALPAHAIAFYDQAMLSTSNRLAKKLALVLAETGIRQSQIADGCGVSKQAVQGWVKTGRIDKKHLTTLAELSGRSLGWWLDADDGKEQTSIDKVFEDWRLKASPRSVAVIDQLTIAARKNALKDDDWLLIGQIVQRLAAAATPASRIGVPIAEEHTQELERLSREAEERHGQKQKRPRVARR